MASLALERGANINQLKNKIMAIIKDAELKMAKVHIQEAIEKLELVEENDNIRLDYIIDQLSEALAHLNN